MATVANRILVVIEYVGPGWTGRVAELGVVELAITREACLAAVREALNDCWVRYCEVDEASLGPRGRLFRRAVRWMVDMGHLTVVLFPAEDGSGGWICHCIELDIASPGGTSQEAYGHLVEAVEMTVADDSELGLNTLARARRGMGTEW